VLVQAPPLPVAETVSIPVAELPSCAKVEEVVAVYEKPFADQVQSFSWTMQPLWLLLAQVTATESVMVPVGDTLRISEGNAPQLPEICVNATR
jgi:hypothetical protein